MTKQLGLAQVILEELPRLFGICVMSPIRCLQTVLDQGVGGSNPLSPTNLFKDLNCTSGFPSTSMVSKL